MKTGIQENKPGSRLSPGRRLDRCNCKGPDLGFAMTVSILFLCSFVPLRLGGLLFGVHQTIARDNSCAGMLSRLGTNGRSVRDPSKKIHLMRDIDQCALFHL